MKLKVRFRGACLRPRTFMLNLIKTYLQAQFNLNAEIINIFIKWAEISCRHMSYVRSILSLRYFIKILFMSSLYYYLKKQKSLYRKQAFWELHKKFSTQNKELRKFIFLLQRFLLEEKWNCSKLQDCKRECR